MFIAIFWVGYHWQWGTNQLVYNFGYNLDREHTQWGQDRHATQTPGKMWRSTLKKKFIAAEKYAAWTFLAGALQRVLREEFGARTPVDVRNSGLIGDYVTPRLFAEMESLLKGGGYSFSEHNYLEDAFRRMDAVDAITWFSLYHDAVEES